MRRVLTVIFSAVLALAAVEPYCAAQNYVAPPVSISTVTVERDGKVYYEHKVLEKQTLYSISRVYEVYIDEIYAANPGLKENGLKKGSVIYIPAKAVTAPVAASGEDAAVSEDGIVENAANSAAITAAPEAKTGENGAISGKNTANSAVIDKTATSEEKTAAEIKADKKAAKKAEKEKKKNSIVHTVKWYETLEDISEKYGVPVSVIIKFNELTDTELKARQKLLIPTNPEDYIVETPEPETPESAATASDSTAIADSLSLVEELTKIKKVRPSFLSRNDICATLLLPFNAASGTGNDLSMDFYSGVLLAAKHLSEDSGISLYINTFDCYGDVLPDAGELNYSDFIVAMLSKDGFEELLENVPKETLVVSPLDANTLPLAENNSNFYQCSNSTAAQYADIAQWITEDIGEDDRIIVIHENSLVGADQAEEAEEALRACGLTWSEFSYSILEGRNINESLVKLMAGWTEEKESEEEEESEEKGKVERVGVSRVIIATSNEAFANDVVRNLNVLLHSDYKIVLYGGSKIRGFDNIPVENLHSVNFHSSLSFYTNYDDPRVRKFLMEYRALYNTEPSQTAFQGYDIMYYFTTATRKVGAMHHMERPKNTPMLMSDFEFEKCGDKGGYVRTGIRRTVYEPNYSITYLK